MLQRIYELVGAQKELDDYLHRLEEAEKRDHRKLGRNGSFHFRMRAQDLCFGTKKDGPYFKD